MRRSRHEDENQSVGQASIPEETAALATPKTPSNFSVGGGGEKPKEGSSGIMDYPSQIEPPEQFQSEEPGAGDTSVRRRNKFQRSVSIGGSSSAKTGRDASKARTRNSSYEDYPMKISGGNADFLSHTSPAWKKLFEQGPISSKLFESPVISFLMRWNDLESLQQAMKLTLRKAVCRVYAMQAFNWLLR